MHNCKARCLDDSECYGHIPQSLFPRHESAFEPERALGTLDGEADQTFCGTVPGQAA